MKFLMRLDSFRVAPTVMRLKATPIHPDASDPVSYLTPASSLVFDALTFPYRRPLLVFPSHPLKPRFPRSVRMFIGRKGKRRNHFRTLFPLRSRRSRDDFAWQLRSVTLLRNSAMPANRRTTHHCCAGFSFGFPPVRKRLI